MNPEFDETSLALIRAAHEILESSGPEALTVRRIAAQAGMSTMNVYSRFDGKDGVIDELYADGFRRLAAALQAVPTTDNTIADILNTLHEYRRFALENPAYYGIMFRSSSFANFQPSQGAVAIASTCLFSLRARVELAQARGDLAESDEWSSTDISAWLWSTVHGLVSLEIYKIGIEFVSWESIFTQGIRTAVDGIRPRAHTALSTASLC